MTDPSTPHHIKPCKQIFSIMKYGVNRVTLVGNVSVTLLYRLEKMDINTPRVSSDILSALVVL